MIRIRTVAIATNIGLFFLLGYHKKLPRLLVPTYCHIQDAVRIKKEKAAHANWLIMPGDFYEDCLRAHGLLQ